MGIYDNIKEVCKDKGISINKLEQTLGFARSSISKFNTNIPSSEKISLVAKELGVSVEYLMTGKETEKETQHYYLDDETREYANELKNNKELKMLFDASRNAKKEDLKMVYDMLLALKKREQHEED